MQNMFDMF